MWTDMKPAIEMPQLFEQGGDLISLAGGLPDLTRLPLGDIADRLGRMVRLGGRTMLQYSTPHVATSLVPAITDLMDREQVQAPAEHLVPTAGSQMGLTAVALGLASPGETIVCQTPAYPGAMTAFRAAGLRLAAAPTGTDGIDAGELRSVVAALRERGERVRLLYCNPTFQNPTGATMSWPGRAALLEACRELDLLVVEDNPYGLLSFDGTTTPAVQSLDPDAVVYLGTFSKVFAPGLRCGWIAAPSHLAPALRRMSEVMTLSPSPLAQQILATFHNRNGWSDLVASYQESYRERAGLMADALRRELGGADGGADADWEWDEPRGGFYLWLRHRGGHGRHFSIDGEHASALRLCFSNVPVAKIDTAVTRLAAALSETRVPS